MPEDDAPGLLPLVGAGSEAPGPAAWDTVQTRCTACGSVGVLDEGEVSIGGRPLDWVGSPTQDSFYWGLSGLASHSLPVSARRCRECGHLDLFAPSAGGG